MTVQLPFKDRMQIASKLDSILHDAKELQRGFPAPAALAPTARFLPEELRLVMDAQAVAPREGTAAPFAAPIPESIPMTGEEDPLVEVDNPDFADVVAEFMRSERRAGAAGGVPARTELAEALLPFAEGATEPAMLVAAIEAPFARFSAAVATDPGRHSHPADPVLLRALVTIVAEARDALAGHCGAPPA
ncbi:hypothetical protein [Sphingomonas sp.]|uniref:hypothetical protein n=1 Tax=Sphingomonas sp. TaxID=28214 RepID=UPI0031CF1CCD